MEIKQQWNEKDSQFIREKLIEYNMTQVPEGEKTALENTSFVLRNDEEEIVGGVTATMFWYHMHIDFLWVSEKYRGEGYGRELIQRAEELAKEKGCYLILLDTFSFQAPEFYQKLGFSVIGKIDDHPRGFQQFIFEKRI